MEKIPIVLSVDTIQSVISALAAKLTAAEYTNDYYQRQAAQNAELAIKQHEEVAQHE